MGVELELERALGSDLCALVRTLTEPLLSATPLSGCGYPGYKPRAFRLQFADGRLFKGREVDTARQAEVVEHVSRCVGGSGLPAVLARRGRALLTEWVEGHRLEPTQCPADVVRQGGALHGFLHTRPVPQTTPHQPRDPLGAQRTRLQNRLKQLVQSAALRQAEADTVLAIARVHAPKGCAVGFTFGDLCAENIVVRPSGDLCMVDNEGLEVGPCDYDLGRTWYRWPMDPAQRAAYFEGYRAHRSLDEFRARFPYWAIMALVDGAAFRESIQAGSASVPLGLLRVVVHAVEGGSGIDALLALPGTRGNP